MFSGLPHIWLVWLVYKPVEEPLLQVFVVPGAHLAPLVFVCAERFTLVIVALRMSTGTYGEALAEFILKTSFDSASQ